MAPISVKDRLKFYFGDVDFRAPLPQDAKTGFDKPVLITPDYDPRIHYGTAYPMDIKRLLAHSPTKTFWANCGDATYSETKYPILIKVRKESTHTVRAAF